MKTRQGFVSNSSSSSFLVAFARKPETREELRTILFEEGQTEYPVPWDFYDVKSYPVDRVLDTVWADLQDQAPVTDAAAIELLCNGTVDGIHRHGDNVICMDGGYETGVSYDDFRDKKTGKTDFKGYRRAERIRAEEFYQEFVRANPGTVLFKFTYSDNDGDYFSCLEHGSLFDRVPCVVISHH